MEAMSRAGSQELTSESTTSGCDVAFIVWSLSGGGAERKCATLANEMTLRGYSVAILTVDPPSDRDYPIHPKLRRLDIGRGQSTDLSTLGKIKGVLQRFRSIKKALQELNPRSIVSQGHVLGLYSECLRPSKANHVVWTMNAVHGVKVRDYRFTLLKFLCNRRGILCVTQTDLIYGMYEKAGLRKLITIPNPVAIPDVRTRVEQANGPLHITSVGRLDEQKSYDILLESLAILNRSHQDWRCSIVGEGHLGPKLEKQSMELGIDSKVDFTGWVEDVRGLLRKTDIFILTSWHEGQPNALLEAMSESVPCISTDFIGGAAQELLGENEAGIVVPVGDTQAIADSIQSLMGDQDQRRELGARGREVVMQFSVDRVTDRWVEALGLRRKGLDGEPGMPDRTSS